MKVQKQNEARELRKQGLSLAEISNKLGVSKSSASLWTRQVVLSTEAIERLTSKRSIPNEHYINKRRRNREIGFSTSVDCDDLNVLWGIGASLYWAEGSKKISECTITNSDPTLLRVFIKFLDRCLRVNKSSIRLWIYSYIDVGKTKEDLVNYWTKELNLDQVENVYMSFIKSKKKKIKNQFGVARLSVFDGSVVQRIYGVIDKINGHKSTRWLM